MRGKLYAVIIERRTEMNGKSRCKILKEIRRQIAERNDIEFITSECKYQGDCAGTCPKCEAEVRYLEKELKKREMLGKTVVVAGLALAVAVSAVGCKNETTDLKPENEKGKESQNEDTKFLGWMDYGNDTDTTDGDMIIKPDVSELLALSAEERNEYISQYDRYDIRGAWNNASAVLGDTLDVFYAEELGKMYIIRVTYDEKGVPVSIDVEEVEEETSGDPAW